MLFLDVNETLSDTSAMPAHFEDADLPGHLAATWFAGVLREGFALAARGTAAPFADLAAAELQALAGVDAPVEAVLEAFTGLEVHADVREGLPLMAASGIRLVTLSNGAASVAEGLLRRAGLREHVGACLSVDTAGVWKPHPRAYRWALDQCVVGPGEAMLAAAHPWDVAGAQDAGLRGALIVRGPGVREPSYLPAPDLVAGSFGELAAQLAELD